MLTSRWAAVVIVIAAGGACSRSDVASQFTLRDSAGVAIAESTLDGLDQPATWTVSAQPTLVIGREGESAYEFDEIAGLIRFPNNVIAVADRGSGTIRFYDAGGRHISSVGGRGQGPGEYLDLHMMAKSGPGKLFVFDRQLNRITVLDHDGVVQDVIRLSDRAASAYPLASGGWLAPEAEGHYGGRVDRTAAPGLHRFEATALILDRAGAAVDSIGPFPGREVAVTNVQGRFGVVPAVYGRTLSFATHGDLIYVGTGEEFGVTVYSSNGTLQRKIRIQGAERVLTDDDASRFYAATLSSMPQDRRTLMQTTYDAAARPATIAPYSRMLIDASGHVWLSEYENPYISAENWRVVASDGTYIGPVPIPAGLHVMEIGSDYVLGKWKDELGVEQVRLHQLTRG